VFAPTACASAEFAPAVFAPAAFTPAAFTPAAFTPVAPAFEGATHAREPSAATADQPTSSAKAKPARAADGPAAKPAPGNAPAPAPVATPWSAVSPEILATRREALAMEERGDLVGAKHTWLGLVPKLPMGEERDACVANARMLDARMILRAEIVAACPRDERVFAEIGIERADERCITSAGKVVAWIDVPIPMIARAAAAARASRSAANGAVYEALARGTDAQKREALVDLGKQLVRGEIDPPDAFAAVARVRNEYVPKRGYRFDEKKGEWSSVDVTEARAAASGLEELATKLVTAPTAQCDALLASLDALGPDAKARTNEALQARFQETCRVLARSGIDKIEAIADARRELDARRKKALDLIFDEDKYFYPYNPPECPADKARLYPAVQQEVDALVGEVREAWKNTRRATQTPALRVALSDLDWVRAQHKARKIAATLPPGVPAWVDGLDRAADVVDMRSFAWDANERATLTRNAQITARNARVWASKDVAAVKEFDKRTAEDAIAGKDEQDQVTITNEYRVMMGRTVLAWSPRLQAAAQGHSDYMANTGDFSHFEKDPKRRTPGDRMRLVGYTGGGGENCHMGGGGPEGAHVGWTHSSGHHRNILTATHREMGSAAAGDYWTQNYGSGNEFEKDLTASKP